jgi:hypothetical protein
MSRPLITVKTLIEQSRRRGEIELPADALVTPAADDWLRGSKVPVRRVDGAGGTAAPRAALYVVGDEADPAVRTLLPILERQRQGVKFLSCRGSRAGLLEAVRETCEGLAGCPQRRGIVLVQDGAVASCVANRHPTVRAAIASRPSALTALVRELGINLLILETGRVSLRQMQAMIDVFLAGKSGLDPRIEAALAGAGEPSVSGGGNACNRGG